MKISVMLEDVVIAGATIRAQVDRQGQWVRVAGDCVVKAGDEIRACDFTGVVWRVTCYPDYQALNIIYGDDGSD